MQTFVRLAHLITSTSYFTKIITNRITNTADIIQPKEQTGFRKGFSNMDHLHVVNQLTEKCSE